MRTNRRGAVLQRVLSSVLPVVLATAPPLAAQGGNGLEVRSDPQHVVGSSLVGEWRLDADLQQRLGGGANGFGERLVFRADPTVLAKVPAKLAERLREMPIVLAGTMARGDTENAFLVTTLRGNPTLVWFRERGGDPLGDAESNTLMLARGAVPQADLLFVGGDSNNPPFAAYARDAGPKPQLTPVAALAQMIALLETGRTREFVEGWCAPDDLAAVGKDPEAAIQRIVARLQGEGGKELLDLLRKVGRQEPKTNEAGDLAHWDVDLGPGRPKQLRLQRIDGRWYLRNR